jgi:ATP-dependent Clp protease ATP-binding subunit ClpA
MHDRSNHHEGDYRNIVGHGKLFFPLNLYMERLSECRETLAGLHPKNRVHRSRDVQSRFLEVLTDPGLGPYLKEQILGQEETIDQLTARLLSEVLSRPPHQPIRYCAEGTPGTGKSESAALIAEKLGIPLVHIDAPSIPGPEMAQTQLLGSGVGFVGSYSSGVLEQAAKHYSGVVVEISDLDHAPIEARSKLADIFLTVMDNGTARATAGPAFSCRNMILAFTMNLPNGMDERIRRTPLGFNRGPSEIEIERTVASEIRTMLSGAFLSRIGTPILFRTLSPQVLGAILERIIRSALVQAAANLGHRFEEVVIEQGTGEKLLNSLNLDITTFGTRLLLERGRLMASRRSWKKQEGVVCRRGVSGSPRFLLIV